MGSRNYNTESSIGKVENFVVFLLRSPFVTLNNYWFESKKNDY